MTLKEGAIEPWTRPQHEWAKDELKQFCKSEKISLTVPFTQLPRAEQRAIIEGKRRLGRRAWLLRLDGNQEIQAARSRLSLEVSRLHVVSGLQRRAAAAGSARCEGRWRNRCRKFARCRSKTLQSSLIHWNSRPNNRQSPKEFFLRFSRRLRFLVEVGLDYLTLDRLASTLSGGEAQRIQLATNLGSSLVGALYVLDEPSIGLHPRDNDRLICLLHNLRDIGNTVLVVEHDAEMMRAADHILDIGPARANWAADVIFEGDFARLVDG